MANKPTPSLAHAVVSPVAEEVPASAPPPAPAPEQRASPIAPAPLPEHKDDALEIPGNPETLRVLITHGVLRHDGKKYPPDSEARLPAALAKQYEAQGIVRIIRRPA